MTIRGETHMHIEAGDHGLPLILTFGTSREWLPGDDAQRGGWSVDATLAEARVAGTPLDLGRLCAAMGPGWRRAVEEAERERLEEMLRWDPDPEATARAEARMDERRVA